MADYDRYGRGDRYSNDRYGAYRSSEDRDYRGRGDDRSFFERGADEVRSWFGDEDAHRRRHRDGDGYHYDAGYRDGRYEPDNRNAGFQGTWGREQGYGDYNRRPDPVRDGGFAARSGRGDIYSGRSDYAQDRARAPDHDADYRSWRDRQVASFDRDYEDYRRERQDRFHNDFESWRSNRGTQAGAEATGVQWRTKIRDHQEVLGSDGDHVGTVDHVKGDRIQLTKRDGDGEHHYLPLTAIVSVDNAVRLNVSAADARRQWRGEAL